MGRRPAAVAILLAAACGGGKEAPQTAQPAPDAGCGTTCPPCGGENQACCANRTCTGDLICAGLTSFTCIPPCGHLGEPCCGAPGSSSTCSAGSACAAGTCVTCGGDEQPCCESGCTRAASVCWPEVPNFVCHPLDLEDPDFRPGFPVEIPPGWPVVVVDDVDGPPDREILLSGVDGFLRAFKSDGTSPRGWPIQIPGAPAAASISTAPLSIAPAASAVVATLFPLGLAAFAGNGTPLPGWPRLDDGFFIPTFADLDGDGSGELIACGTVTLFGYRPANRAAGACGGWIPGWP